MLNNKPEPDDVFHGHSDIDDAFSKIKDTQSQVILDACPVYVSVIVNGKFVYWNKYFEKLTGLSKKEISGLRLTDLIEPDCKMEVKRVHNELLAKKKKSVIQEFKIKSKNGKVTWLRYYNQLIDLDGSQAIRGCGFDITEQKEAQIKLSESESEYKNLSEISPDGIAVAINDKIAYINPAGAKIFGAEKPEELTGKIFLDFIHPDFRQIVKERKNSFQSGKIAPIMEKKFLRSDGSDIDVELTSRSTTYKGKPALLAVFRDVTERKNAEKEYRKFKFMSDNANDAYFLVDEDSKFRYVNKAAANLFGYSEEELMRLSVPEVDVNFGIEKYKELFKLVQKEKVKPFETLNKRKDGSTFPSEISAAGIKIDEAYYLFAILRDISESKKEKTELEFKSLLLDSATDSILVHDFDGNLIYVNEAAYKLRGYTKEELLSKNLREIDTPEMAVKIPENIEKLKKYGKAVFESSHWKKDKTVIPIEVHARTLDYHGKKVIVGIARDIEERKRAEMKLKNAFYTEQRISKTLQKSLLPSDVPQIEELEVRFLYQPSEKEAEVGGDFYDLFETALGNYGIILGDVEGKGLDAAAETAKVKYLLRDKAFSGLPPQDVLSQVNTALFKQKGRPFTALTYCIFDPNSSTLVLSNAGNPYPYNATKDYFIYLSGVPVSIMPKQYYDSSIIKLEKDDIILMYTDGLVETRKGNDLFGEERVREFVKNNLYMPSEQLLEELVNETRRFSDNNLRDDILVIYLRKRTA